MKKLSLFLALVFTLALLATACGNVATDPSAGTDDGAGHVHSYSAVYEFDECLHWQKCSGCSETTSPSNHQFDDGITTVYATETSPGEIVYSCIICEFSKIDVIPALGHSHSFSDSWSYDSTSHWHASNCGHDVTDSLSSHTFDTGSVLTSPTEDTDGEMLYTCTVCRYTKTESIPALGHSHSFSDIWCADDSGHWHIASCGHEAVSEKLEHNWNDGTIIELDDTNELNALVEYTCLDCGYKKAQKEMHTHTLVFVNTGNVNYHEAHTACENHGELSVMLEHSFDEGSLISEPTATDNGSMKYTCLDCGYEKTVVIEHEHTYSSEWSYDSTHHWRSATCAHSSTYGYAEHDYDESGICATCGRVFSDESGLTYTLSDDGTYYIVSAYSCTGSDESRNLYIPAAHLGKPVLEIGDNVFRSVGYDVYSITLPEGILKIGEYAFYECATYITVPSTVETVGAYAFYNYTYTPGSSLIPASLVTVGDYAYAGASLGGFYIPDSVRSIGAHAFDGATADGSYYSELNISSSVETIGTNAFANTSICYVLTFGFDTFRADMFENSTIYGSIQFTDGCKIIESGSVNFSGVDIYVGTTVEVIEDGAFCMNYNSIHINAPNAVMGNYNFGLQQEPSYLRLEAIKEIGDSCFVFTSIGYDLYLPEGLVSIGDNSFIMNSGNSVWMTLSIPSTLTEIGSDSLVAANATISPYEKWCIEYGGTVAQWSEISLPDNEIWRHAEVSASDGVAHEAEHTYLYEYSDEQYHTRSYYCSCHYDCETLTEEHDFIANGTLMVCVCGYEVENDPHEHTFETVWDDSCHWKVTNCKDHDPVTSDPVEHTFVDSDDGYLIYRKCSDCGYYVYLPSSHQHTYYEQWSTDAYYHWHAASCAHSQLTSDMSQHTFEDGICTVCSYTADLFEYEDYDGESYKITGINTAILGDADYYVINIPAYHDGLPVRALGDDLFIGIGEATKTVIISIPETVEYIGSSCFAKTRIHTLKIPDSVKSLASWAFSGAVIEHIELGCGLTVIPERALNGMITESLTIPEGVKRIEENALSECTNLKALYLPSTIEYIGYQSGLNLLDANSFGMIYFNGTVAQFESVSVDFTSWTGVYGVQVTCTDGVCEIGEQHECDVAGGMYLYDGIYHWNVTMCEGHDPIMVNVSEHSFTTYSGSWGSYTRCICGYMIDEHYHEYSTEWTYNDTEHWHAGSCGCEGLESDRTYHEIDSSTGACTYCGYEPDTFIYELNADGMSYTITSVNMNIDISSLTELVFPDEYLGLPVTAIGYGTEITYSGYNITSIVLPDTVTSIGAYAFRDFALTHLVIPDSVTYIGEYAFYECRSLTSVQLGSGLTSLSAGVFCGCHQITQFTIPGNVKTVDQNAIYSTGLSVVTVEEGVERIEMNAFGGSYISDIYLPSSIEYFGGIESYNATVGAIHYSGTKSEWLNAAYEYTMYYWTSDTAIICSDGQLTDEDIADM